MATMTIASPAQANANLNYVQNVGRAARAFLAALLDVKSHQAVSQEAPAQRTTWLGRDDTSDFMMPNLEQELICLAGRRP